MGIEPTLVAWERPPRFTSSTIPDALPSMYNLFDIFNLVIKMSNIFYIRSFNMSAREKRTWFELALWSFIIFFLWMRLTDGVTILGQSFGLSVIDQDAVTLLRTYGSIGAMAAIGQLIIRSVLFARNSAEEELDERDVFIERKSDQVGYWVGVGGINLVIVHVLLTERFRFREDMPLDFVSPAGILLSLFTVFMAQEVARGITILVLYRRS